MEKSTIKFYTFSILLCYFREREGGSILLFLVFFSIQYPRYHEENSRLNP